jgi:hypothetical protein
VSVQSGFDQREKTFSIQCLRRRPFFFFFFFFFAASTSFSSHQTFSLHHHPLKHTHNSSGGKAALWSSIAAGAALGLANHFSPAFKAALGPR